MSRITLAIVSILISSCSHLENLDKRGDLSKLGIVLLDYHDEHIELTVNGDKVLDEIIFTNPGLGGGVSTQFIIKTSQKLTLEFCVDDECRARTVNRSNNDHYLIISRMGPTTSQLPHIELGKDLRGID